MYILSINCKLSIGLKHLEFCIFLVICNPKFVLYIVSCFKYYIYVYINDVMCWIFISVYGTYDDVSLSAFMEAQLNSGFRKEWDDSVLELRVLDSHTDSNSDLVYWLVKFPVSVYVLLMCLHMCIYPSCKDYLCYVKLWNNGISIHFITNAFGLGFSNSLQIETMSLKGASHIMKKDKKLL